MHRTILPAFSVTALVVCLAAPAAAADLGHGISISGGATVVSDYRFRGISQTNIKPALQGTFTISHASGFYATVWGSSIDDYVEDGADQELDLIGGYKHTWGGTTLDVGLLYYYYPGAQQLNHNWKSDFAEPYVSVAHTLGPLTAKVTANYAPKQKALALCQPGCKSQDNFYLAGDLSAGIPKTPISLAAHLGHTWGPSYLTIGKQYTDWNVGATWTTGPLSIGIQYVDTNRTARPVNHNIAGAGVVGSIGVAF
jgi:uncharacterized protein (TIGR02001 family)